MEHSLFKSRTLAIVISIVMVVGMLTFFYPNEANAFYRPFGGAIITLWYGCVNGYLVTVGPPIGGIFMWVPWTYNYLYVPPYRPGQFLTGMLGPPITCWVPCTFGLCPYGLWETLLYQGAST